MTLNEINFLKDTKYTTNEKLVYLALKSFLRVGEDTGTVYPSLVTLGEMVKLSKPTLVSVIKKLIEHGLITKKRVGQGRNNIYEILPYVSKYEKEKPSAPKKSSGASTNKFHNFDQRNYDYDELEKLLTSKK